MKNLKCVLLTMLVFLGYIKLTFAQHVVSEVEQLIPFSKILIDIANERLKPLAEESNYGLEEERTTLFLSGLPIIRTTKAIVDSFTR